MPTPLPTTDGPEIQLEHPPVVPIPQNPEIPTGRLARVVNLFPKGQFVRYLCVGVWNTFFGYLSYAGFLYLFSHLLSQRFLYLAVIIASLVSTPINITMAYFCYKFFVFRTQGNYLMEWLRCFAVYGLGMLPGLLILSALTRLLQTLFHTHRESLLGLLANLQHAVSGSPAAVSFLHHASDSRAAAGYIAGALVMGFTTVSGFIGHRKFSFKPAKSAPASAPTP
jgi:putative flippase GtrA